MGSILSVNMSSSENMCALAELSNMNVYPSESNPICSEGSTLEDNIWHSLTFEIWTATFGVKIYRYHAYNKIFYENISYQKLRISTRQ